MDISANIFGCPQKYNEIEMKTERQKTKALIHITQK